MHIVPRCITFYAYPQGGAKSFIQECKCKAENESLLVWNKYSLVVPPRMDAVLLSQIAKLCRIELLVFALWYCIPISVRLNWQKVLWQKCHLFLYDLFWKTNKQCLFQACKFCETGCRFLRKNKSNQKAEQRVQQFTIAKLQQEVLMVSFTHCSGV